MQVYLIKILYSIQRKTLKEKSHEENEIFVRSLEHNTIENFDEILNSIHFPDYLQRVKVFKNGPSKTCGGQPLKNFQ